MIPLSAIQLPTAVDCWIEMARCGKSDVERGFTLVELLIAIFIFAIVISSVYGAYRATFRIIGGAEDQLSVSRNGRVALERIVDDLKSVVTGPGGELRGERVGQAGTRSDNLAFISSSHLALSAKDTLDGYTVIEYSVERNAASSLFDLYRSDRILLPGAKQEDREPPKDILAAGLQEVHFSYVDADDKVIDEWQSEGGITDVEIGEQQEIPLLPRLIYIRLVFAKAIDSKDGTVFKTAVALPQTATKKE
jgi:general secretion pathway protein J